MLNRDRYDEFPLDPIQLRVARDVHGQTIVDGGPGTGKTHVGVAHVAALLASGIPPDQATCLTVSPAAAADLHDRLGRHDQVGAVLDEIFVGTVDQFANLLLRRFGANELGLSPHYSIWDRRQAEDAAALAIRATGADEALRQQLRRALNWHWTGKRRPSGDPGLPARDAAWPDIVRTYDREKHRQNALDVEDLAVLAVRWLRWIQKPLAGADLADQTAHRLELIRKQLNAWVLNRCRHLLVDQAEDLNPCQAELAELLVNREGSALIVIDPNQTTGDPQFDWVARSWRWRLGQVTPHQLTVSHCGTQPLSELANALKQNPALTGLVADRQRPHLADGPMPRLVEVSGSKHEVIRRCLDDVQRVHDEGVDWEDIAVVHRSPSALRAMKTSLLHRNIPYRALEEGRFQRPTDARWIVAMLTAALNPHDLAAVRVAAASGHPNRRRELRDGMAAELLKTAREQNINLIDAAGKLAANADATDRDDLIQLVAHWRMVDRWLDDEQFSLVDLLERATMLVCPSHAVSDDYDEPETKWLWDRCFDTPTLTGEGFRDHLRRFLDGVSPALGQVGERDAGLGVTFSTMRAAKGRQWSVVMILDVSDSVIPGKAEGDRLKREERLLFTAITRATEQLVLYLQADTGQGNAPTLSRFLEPVRHLLTHDPVDVQVPLRSIEATPTHAENGSVADEHDICARWYEKRAVCRTHM